MRQFTSESRALPKSITLEEFKKLIKNTKNKVFKIAFLLGFGSGMRISEVINLKKDHFDKNFITIYEGKGKKDRVVPIPKGWRSSYLDYIPIKKSARSLQRNFKSSVKKAKLNEKYTFHSLRHGFATRCIEKGVPINQLQVLIGHGNLQTTSIYTKARPMDSLKSYENLF